MSNTIYNKNKNRSQENLPYVYYLEWTDLNKKYIGCRYAKDCHPEDLFESYFTSSKSVKELLDNNQYPDIIKILSTHSNADEALEEEKRLLLENDAIVDESFLNMSYGAGGFSFSNVVKKYGVDNVFQNEEIKEKIKHTNIEKYGVENVSQSEEIKEKKKRTYIKNWGVDHPIQNEEIKEKMKQTMLEKYGVDHYSKTDEYKEKIKQTRSNEKNLCPFGCVTRSGNKYFNNGNFAIHMKKKHPEYQFQK